MEVLSALLSIFIVGLFFFKFTDCISWCKWLVLYTYIGICKRKIKKRIDLYDYTVLNDPVKTNFVIPSEEYEFESPQTESHLQYKNDEIFFYGGNSKSELLAVKINRKCNNKAEAYIFLKLETGKIYKLEKTIDFQQACVDEMTFSCGGLQMECQSPMRRWRLFFAGYLRNVSEENVTDPRMIYVKFALLWKAASDVYDFKSDISPKTYIHGLADVPLKKLQSEFNNLQDALDFYGQAGTLHGEVKVENEFENKEIYLFGQRIRYLGDTTQMKSNEFHHMLGYTQKSGKYIHLSQIKNLALSNVSFGFVVQSNCDLDGTDETSVSIFESNKSLIGSISAKFKTGRVSFNCDGCTFGFDVLEENESSQDFKRIEFSLNGETGYGILYKRPTSELRRTEFSEIKKIKMPAVIPDVVTFKEEICQLPEVCGGKGSSLGKLTHLSEELKTYSVPDGVVVTTKAYAKFLNQNILEEVECLEKHSYKKDRNLEEITAACKRISESIINTDFTSELLTSITRNINTYFGEKVNTVKFAIRSSATGEDTEQMSAAGQMDTFLGVSGIDEILLAVKKCWASQFSFIATEYKRRYGQCFNSPMAVVIQEMVPCDVAGVLFTCDPLTGNPTLMSITANYGLGESVVSGTEEPDMIQIKRDDNGKLHIKSITIGEKSKKITIADAGTNTEEVNDNERKVCCVPEQMMFYLGYTAIEIEAHYRSHQDIEWGILNDKLYIFQSRPVTSNTKESIHEIEHEFDSPMRVENDFFSVSNVAEVMPKAMSPLGIDASFKCFFIAPKVKTEKTVFTSEGKNEYFPKVWLFYYNHFIFNFADLFPMKPNEEMDIIKKATIIALFGRIPDNEEMYEVAKTRSGSAPAKSPLLTMYYMLKALLLCGTTIEKAKKWCRGYRIPIEKYSTSKDLFPALCIACTDLIDVTLCHVNCSQTSSLLNMIVFSVLGAAHGKFDDTVYKDFAKLLKTNSDVESADVPSAMQRIAYLIAQEMKPEQFKEMSRKEALKWLQTSQSEAGKQFRNFMQRHGHRSVQEFDLYSLAWRETPEQLVNLLQTLTGFVSKDVLEKKSQSFNDALTEITIRPGIFSKMVLKFILPYTRRGVQHREMSKSLVIKGMDEWRKGWRCLAQLMVQEGRIPEEDLLFFMTVNEIKNLLNTRSPKIIAKATLRMKRHPAMNDYRFPEIMKGFPRPMDLTATEDISNEGEFSMQGIPVSQGIAKGYVRKAITIEEAADIKPGEILVTLGTDIAWSPYFPHLSGVVTELGGLISHGAVVSREYGIPCIAGLHGATKYFQTGDYVLLDGNRGVLQKIESTNNSKTEDSTL